MCLFSPSPDFRPISRRIVSYILLFSLFFTAVTVGLRLYHAYGNEREFLRRNLAAAAESRLGALTHALWEYELGQVNSLLSEIAASPGVAAVRLKTSIDTTTLVLAKGVAFDEQSPQQVLQLRESISGSHLGELTLYGDLEQSNRRLRQDAIEILATQGVQVFALALLIYWLLSRLLTRHVTDLARHLSTLTPERLDRAFSLQRRPPGQRDELDCLASRINQWQAQMAAYIADQRRYEAELAMHRDNLAQLVEERTAQLEAANRQLETLARTDHLTGLANRRTFDASAEAEYRRALRNGHELSLLLLDVDFFKRYNDTYGHAQGDECLVAVAGALQASFARAGELPARVGGEEFAVLLPNVSRDAACELAEALRERIWNLALPHAASAVADRVTVSIGVCTLVPEQHDCFGALLVHADQALYEAKHRSRNTVACA